MPVCPEKKLRLYLVTAFISLLIFLLSAEVLVRSFLPFNTPDTIRKYSLQYIGSIFARHRLKPMGQTVEEDSDKALGKKGKNEEPAGRFFINDVGYRGPNFSKRKPQGIKRIIIIGGSTVFDINATDETASETRDWPHLVERFLRNKGYNNVEVINAGIPGHASFDSLGRLYSQLWMYEPDYVLFYGAWNDIVYFRKLTLESPLISLYAPYYPNSNPYIEYQGLLDRFLSSSQLYVKLRNQYYSWKHPVGKEGVIPQGEYQDTYSAYAVRQYRLNVELIVDTCRNIKAVPILLTEATIVSPDNSADERKMIGYVYPRLTHAALVRALDEAGQVIRSVVQEKKVAFIDLAKELNGKRDLFIDGIHLSTKGGEEVATRVADFLASQLKEKSNARNFD